MVSYAIFFCLNMIKYNRKPITSILSYLEQKAINVREVSIPLSNTFTQTVPSLINPNNEAYSTFTPHNNLKGQ